MSTTVQIPAAQDASRARTTTAVRIVVALSLLAACALVLAEPPGPTAPAVATARLSVEQLERAFWACEYAATTRGVGAGEGMACGVVNEALKARKFGGDFEALLAWWRDRKDAALAALAGAEGRLAANDFPPP